MAQQTITTYDQSAYVEVAYENKAERIRISVLVEANRYDEKDKRRARKIADEKVKHLPGTYKHMGTS